VKYIKELKINSINLIKSIKDIRIDFLNINYEKFNLDDMIMLYNNHYKNNQDDYKIRQFNNELYHKVSDEIRKKNKVDFVPNEIINYLEECVSIGHVNIHQYMNFLISYIEKTNNISIQVDGLDIIKKDHPIIYDYIVGKNPLDPSPIIDYIYNLSTKRVPEVEEFLFSEVIRNPMRISTVINYCIKNLKGRNLEFEKKYIFKISDQSNSEFIKYVDDLIFKFIIKGYFESDIIESNEEKIKIINNELNRNNLISEIRRRKFSPVNILMLYRDNFNLFQDVFKSQDKITDFFEKTFEESLNNNEFLKIYSMVKK
jgi:hypothetical protein